MTQITARALEQLLRDNIGISREEQLAIREQNSVFFSKIDPKILAELNEKANAIRLAIAKDQGLHETASWAEINDSF